ncbi:unnamed protein product, partial [Linum tenue]
FFFFSSINEQHRQRLKSLLPVPQICIASPKSLPSHQKSYSPSILYSSSINFFLSSSTPWLKNHLYGCYPWPMGVILEQIEAEHGAVRDEAKGKVHEEPRSVFEGRVVRKFRGVDSWHNLWRKSQGSSRRTKLEVPDRQG